MDIKNGYIRVTELLKAYQDWGDIPKEVLEAKAQIGTNVHEAIENHSVGLSIPNLTPREAKYFDSYLKWAEHEEPMYLCNEERYYDEDLKVTGQIDCIVAFPGRHIGRILDFKTSAKESPLHWPVQATWYYMLCKKNKKDVSDTTHMLQLKDNGSPAKLYTYIATQEMQDLCMSLYDAYVYFNPPKKDKSEDQEEEAVLEGFLQEVQGVQPHSEAY